MEGSVKGKVGNRLGNCVKTKLCIATHIMFYQSRNGIEMNINTSASLISSYSIKPYAVGEKEAERWALIRYANLHILSP